MSPSRVVVLLSLVFVSKLALAQQSTAPPASPSPQRDLQAVALLQQSIAAIAPTPPSDSSATGSVTVVEGSTSQQGTIQIRTLGATQTSETLALSGGQRAVVYSNGDALETDGTQSSNPSLELIVTDQCVDFPLPFLTASLSTSDMAMRFVGQEILDGQSVRHIQVWKTFGSKPKLQKLGPFSIRDIWFNSSTGLPVKISHVRRSGGGSVPGVTVEIFFSNYTRVNGVLYPFQIKKSMNGTPWQAITIQNVSFNSGLTASQFQVE